MEILEEEGQGNNTGTRGNNGLDDYDYYYNHSSSASTIQAWITDEHRKRNTRRR